MGERAGLPQAQKLPGLTARYGGKDAHPISLFQPLITLGVDTVQEYDLYGIGRDPQLRQELLNRAPFADLRRLFRLALLARGYIAL